MKKKERAEDTFQLDEWCPDVPRLKDPIPLKKPISKHQTISLCIIAKNEEENIAKCLVSFRSYVDEIIVVDTGSTDDTKNIALSLGASVYDYTWHDHFSAARNFAFLKATSDWIMWADCDDFISYNRGKEFRTWVNGCYESIDGINMSYVLKHEELKYGPNRGMILPKQSINRTRLVRNKGYLWKGAVHEYIDIPNEKCIDYRDVVVYHEQRPEEEVLAHTDRNLQILKREYALESLDTHLKNRYQYYIAKEYQKLNNSYRAYHIYKSYISSLDISLQELKLGYIGLIECCFEIFGKSEMVYFEHIIQDALAIFAQDDIDINLQLAHYYVLREDWQECYEIARRNLYLEQKDVVYNNIDNTKLIPYKFMIQCLMKLGELDKAKLMATTILREFPFDIELMKLYAKLTTKKTVIVIPTYTMGKRAQLTTCLNHLQKFSYVDKKLLPIYIGVDGSDDCVEFYNTLKEDIKEYDLDIKLFLLSKENLGVAKATERLMDIVSDNHPKGDINVVWMGSDVYITPGWLQHATIECEDKYFVNFNDGLHTWDIAPHYMSPLKYRKQYFGGYFFSDKYNHGYCDQELATKAKELGLFKYAKNAVIIHDHPILSRSVKMDKSYEKALNPYLDELDHDTFNARRLNNWK